MDYARGQQTLSMKGQMDSILGFESRGVYVATLLLQHQSGHKQYVNK